MSVILVSHEQASMRKAAPAPWVRRFLGRVLAELGLRNVEVSVSFVTDASIRELNRQYRGLDEPTDVLSFVQSDGEGFPQEPGKPRPLGDLVVSLETLNNNAIYFRIPFDEELRRVLIHGALHLSGEDHKTNDPSERMLTRQEELLCKLKGGLF